MISCENCNRVLTEVKELKKLVKSTDKNLSTSIKSFTNSNSNSNVIKKRTSSVFNSQIGLVTRSNKITSNIMSKNSA